MSPESPGSPESQTSSASASANRLDPSERILRLNKPLLFGTLAAVVVMGAGLHFARSMQLSRNASTLLDQATEAEESGDLKQAIGFLSQYLRLRPDDADALKQIGSLTNRSESSVDAWFKVYRTYEEVLRRDPRRSDAAEVRWELVKVAMKLERFRDAQTHLGELQELVRADGLDFDNAPGPAELYHRSAICFERLTESKEALAWYLASISAGPDRVDAYRDLAVFILRSDSRLPARDDIRPPAGVKFEPGALSFLPESDDQQPTAAVSRNVARDLLREMVDRGQPTHLAHLARARVLTDYASQMSPDPAETNSGNVDPPPDDGAGSSDPLDLAARDIEQALATAPKDPDVLLAAANHELARADENLLAGRFTDARGAIERAKSRAAAGGDEDPHDLRFRLMESRAELADIPLLEDKKKASDRFMRACKILQKAIDHLPKARAHATALSDLTERDDRLRWIEDLEVRLRWALCDTKISWADALRSGLSPTAEDREKANKLLSDARKLEGILGEMTASRMLPDFIDARVMITRLRSAGEFRNGDTWAAAAQQLEGLRAEFVREPGTRRRLDLLLAECYQNLNNHHSRIKVFERALRDDPAWVRARVELAVHLAELRRFDEAMKQYLSLAYASGVGAVPLHVASMRLRQQLERPPEDRDWKQVRVALDEVPSLARDYIQMPLLDAEYHFQIGEVDRANEILRAAFENEKLSESEHPELWAGLVSVALRTPGVDEASRIQRGLEILTEAKGAVGDHVRLREAAIQVYMLQPDDVASKSLQELSKDVEGLFVREDAVGLLNALAVAHQRLERRRRRADSDASAADQELETVFALCDRISELAPYDLASLMLKGLLALDNRDWETAGSVTSRVRKIEGDGGPIGSYLEASVLIGRSEGSADQSKDSTGSAAASPEVQESLDRARELLQEAVRQRPLWALPVARLGYLEDRCNNRNRAFDHYRNAIRLGMYSPPVVGRVLQQLNREDRTQEAKDLYREVVTNAASQLTGSLARMFVGVAFRPDETDWLEEIANASFRGDDSQQGLALEGARKMLEHSNLSAEDKDGTTGEELKQASIKAFRDALAIPPAADPEGTARVWAAYFNALRYFGDLDREEILSSTAQLPEKPAYLRPYTQAFALRLLPDFPAAEAKYEEAIRLAPENSELRVEVAQFLATIGKTDAARVHTAAVQKMQSASSDSRRAAERLQAVLLSVTGSYADTSQTLEQLRQTLPAEGTDRVSSLRTIVTVLERRRTFRDHLELIDVLEQLQEVTSLTRAEQLRLAELQMRTGKTNVASQTFEKLHRADPSDVLLIATVTRGLLDRTKRAKPENTLLTTAETWVARFERILPGSFSSVALRARLLAEQGRKDAAVKLITEFLSDFSLPEDDQLLFQDLICRKDGTLSWIADQLKPTDPSAEIALRVAEEIADRGDPETAFGIAAEALPLAKVRVLCRLATHRFAARVVFRLGYQGRGETLFRNYLQMTERLLPVPLDDRVEMVAYISARDTGEALAACRPLFEKGSLAVAANASVAMLREGTPSPEHIATVDRWLSEAIMARPRDVDLPVQLSLADLRILQGRFDEAEAIFGRILDANPTNIVTLNNLAWLQAARGKSLGEAYAHISKAIRLAGPIALLVDTRGFVQLARNQHDQAIADYDYVVAAEPTAVAWYHAALARFEKGDQAGAAERFRRSRALGINENSLEALERPSFQRLSKAIP